MIILFNLKSDIVRAFFKTNDPLIVTVTHKETPDRNFFYAICPFCGTENSITFDPETEVQFQTCENCEKQYIADWSKVR